MTAERFIEQNLENHLNRIYDNYNGKVIFDENIVDILNTLNDENEQLKHNCRNYEWYKQYKRLLNENEQLKKDVEYWKQVASQYSNELNVFEHCKKYKTECEDIHWSSD